MNVLMRNPRYRIDPMAELERLQHDINRLLEPGFADAMSGIFDRSVSPAIDVEETADGYVLTAELPGITSKDLDLSIADNVLTIKGEKPRPQNGGKHIRDEFWYGTFQRTVGLPKPVDPDHIDASMKNGVLEVRLSKREEVKPKQITVQVQ